MEASRPPSERRLQPKMSLRYPDGALGCGSDSPSFPIFSEQQPRSQTGHRICQSTEPVRWHTSLQRIAGRALSVWSPLGTYKPVPLSITAAVELPVVTSMLHGTETSLLLGDVPYDLPCRGEIELFLLYYAVGAEHLYPVILPVGNVYSPGFRHPNACDTRNWPGPLPGEPKVSMGSPSAVNRWMQKLPYPSET